MDNTKTNDMKPRNLIPVFTLLAMGTLFMSQKAAEEIITKEDGMTIINTTALATDIEGYAGTTPLKIYVRKNKIERIEALPNMETPKHFARIKRSLLDKWNGLMVKEAARQEVDAVTGATFSSEAVKENVRRGIDYYNKSKH